MVRFSSLFKRLKYVALMSVLVLGQVVTATGPFLSLDQVSAAASANLDQYGNKAPAGWQNGNLGQASSEYKEGETVPFRLIMDDLDTSVSHSVTVEWDTTKSGQHAYDYITSYDQTEILADPCDGVAGCGSPSTFAIPDDPNSSVTQIPGSFTLFNGTIDSVSTYTLTDSYDSDSSTSITITFNTSVSNPVLAWGGHIASEADWGVGNGAGAISGSPYHMRLIELDGKGGNQDRSLSAAAVIQKPNITAIKYVDTDGDGESERTANAGEWSFSLDGGTYVDTDSDGKVEFPDVSDGTHTITESGPSGYSFIGSTGDSLNCVIEDGVGAATVSSGNPSTDAICEFVNGLNTGSLTIVKDSIPDGPQNFSFTSDIPNYETFTLDDETGESTDDVPEFVMIDKLASGTYTITEQPNSEWYIDSIVCRDAQNNIVETGSVDTGEVEVTVASDESITCTYTNRKYGKIIVNKETSPGVDQPFTITASTSDGNIVENPEQTISNGEKVVYTVTQNGTYSVDESTIAGWDQDDSECQNLEIAYNQLTQECTIYNRKHPALTLIKDVIIDDSNDDAVPSDFTLLLSGGQYDNSEFTSGDTPTVTYGVEYTVGEKMNEVFGYEYKGTECLDDNTDVKLTNPLTLAPGQEITCTITNDDISPLLTLNKEVKNEHGEPADPNDWVLSAITTDRDKSDYDTPTGDGNPNDGGGVENEEVFANIAYTLMETSEISGYSLTGWECEGDGYQQSGDLGQFLIFSLGGDVECTAINTRDSATLNVEKVVVPETDAGEFDLYVGSELVKDDASTANGLTGGTTIPTNTNVVVKELGNDGTDLEDYDSSYSCTTEQSGDGTSVTINAANNGDEITCTFTNVRRGTVTINKEANPQDGTDFDFSITTESPFDNDLPSVFNQLLAIDNGLNDGEGAFTLDDAAEDDGDAYGTSQDMSLSPGTYYITEENIPTNWRLADISCEGAEYDTQDNILIIQVAAGDTIDCTFVNEKDAEVVVTKFNDLNRNGVFDEETEDTLADWQMNLTGEVTCDFDLPFPEDELSPAIVSRIPCEEYSFKKNQLTATNGATTFTAVKPGVTHTLSETQQDNWNFSDMYCEEKEFNTEGETVAFQANPGETVDCFVGNYRDLVLNIEKENDSPVADPGDVVTYTLIVSVPEDSGVSYDTSVTDLPPNGFTYIPGSWTANSDVRGNILGSVTTEPTYASPGDWYLGTMMPGEVVTLTYQAEIGEGVSYGTYPDIAYANGCGVNATLDSEYEGICPEDEVVYSNLSTEDEPFVGTTVTLNEPQVLGATVTRNVLVDTGDQRMIAISIIAAVLMSATYMFAIRPSTKRGGVR